VDVLANRSIPLFIAWTTQKILMRLSLLGTPNKYYRLSGNLSLMPIERIYHVKIDDCITCKPGGSIHLFSPKWPMVDWFNGKMLIDPETVDDQIEFRRLIHNNAIELHQPRM